MEHADDYALIQLRVLNIGGEFTLSIYGEAPTYASPSSKLRYYFRDHRFEFGWAVSFIKWEKSGVFGKKS